MPYHEAVKIVFKFLQAVNIDPGDSAESEQLLLIVHLMAAEQVPRLSRRHTALANRDLPFHEFPHIRLHFGKKLLINGDISLNCVIKTLMNCKMQHNLFYILMARYMVYGFQKQQRHAALIRLMSDLVRRCHKRDLLLLLQLLVQLTKSPVRHDQNDRVFVLALILLSNHAEGCSLRVFTQFSVNPYLTHNFCSSFSHCLS